MHKTTVSSRSLVGRLVRSALLWAVPVLILAAFALIWLYRSSTYQIFEDPLVETVTSLISSAEIIESADSRLIITLTQEPVDPRYQRALSGRYWEILSGNTENDMTSEISSRSLYGETMTLAARDIRLLLNAPGQDIRANVAGPDNEELRVVARSVILEGVKRPLIMMAAANQGPAIQAVRNFAIVSVGLLALLTLGLIIAILVQVRSGLRPLFDLQNHVVNVREGHAEQVVGEYPKEIDPLANELNSLIAHNKDIVERARTHVSNLAHALKTPLAVLKNEAEAETGPLADLTRRQAEIMIEQVNHHLSRARAASRAQSIGVKTEVTPVLSDLSRTMSKIYRHKGVSIFENIPAGYYFRGEKTDLEEMAGNLLDNACKWAKSHVALELKNTPEGQITITIEDDGVGLDQGDYKAALKRGIRLDESTPGTGFGLAIVDDLARAYKGQLKLDRSNLGGLQVVLTLPAVVDRQKE